MNPRYWKAIVPVALGIAIAAIPVPQGLDREAWYFFAIFAAVIAALILEPLPAAAAGFAGVFLVAVLGLAGATPAESIRWALSGFSNTTVWLIFGAYMFALGYEKSGLGKRIGLTLVSALGKRTIGLGYAIAFADLILAPFIPSNTARSGGTIFPVIRSLPAIYGSFPGETSRKIGGYLMWTAFAATCITSSMFVTALAPNLLAVELASKAVDIRIGWSEWFIGFLPVGGVLIVLLPWMVLKVYPPEIRSVPEVPAWASGELVKMGAVSRKELLLAAFVILALTLWIFGAGRIDATTVAGVVICGMVITGLISWDDFLSHRQAWNVLVWFATLVALADGLSRVGFVTWFAKSTAGLMVGVSPIAVMIILVAIFFASHYLTASLTAHATAFLPIMLATGAAVPGMPVRTFALLLCYSLGIMGVITPYATGPAPVYFGSGYVSRGDFWKLGLLFGAIFLVTLLGIGVPYLLWT